MGNPIIIPRFRILEWLGEDARDFGLSFESVALVHFRASKNIESKTVHCLLEVADTLKRHSRNEFESGAYTSRRNDTLFAESPPIVLSKSEMEAMAQAFRNDLGLSDQQRIDPLAIVIEGITVLTISEIPDLEPATVAYLEGPSLTTWSAMSVPMNEEKDEWFIVRNERHTIVRQRVSLFEEFWHILLGHKLTKIAKIADAYGRTFDQSEEHDAFYLAAATLLPEHIVHNAVAEKHDIDQIALDYGISPELVEYRIKRLGLWRQYKGRNVRLMGT